MASNAPIQEDSTQKSSFITTFKARIGAVTQGRYKNIITFAVVIGLFFIGIWLASYYSGYRQKQEISDQLVAFTEAANNKNVEVLSTLFAEEYYDTLSYRDASSLGAAQTDNIKSIEILSLSSSLKNGYFRADGTIVYNDGYKAPFVAIVTKQDNIWKILNLDIKLDSERIDSYYKNR